MQLMTLRLRFMRIVLEYIYDQNRLNAMGGKCSKLIKEIDLKIYEIEH